jgi:hypothetical protein
MTTAHTAWDLKALATRYIEAVGGKRLEEVAAMLHPRLEFDGNFGPVPTRGPEGWLAALQRLSPILLRNEVRKVMIEGADACILYDFVTPVCPVPSAEWLTFQDGKITSVYLLFDRSRWPEVLEELRTRQ